MSSHSEWWRRTRTDQNRPTFLKLSEGWSSKLRGAAGSVIQQCAFCVKLGEPLSKGSQLFRRKFLDPTFGLL